MEKERNITTVFLIGSQYMCQFRKKDCVIKRKCSPFFSTIFILVCKVNRKYWWLSSRKISLPFFCMYRKGYAKICITNLKFRALLFRGKISLQHVSNLFLVIDVWREHLNWSKTASHLRLFHSSIHTCSCVVPPEVEHNLLLFVWRENGFYFSSFYFCPAAGATNSAMQNTRTKRTTE